MDLLNLNAPSGTAWELFIAAAVIVVGPLIVERFRTPGMIGLLLGGLVIGPNVLGVVPPEGGVVHEFGDVGLLYLMFLAGLELDLNIFARHRRHAVAFAGITFAGPAALGIAAGLGLGYEVDAAILLGSLCASHTLVTYPIVRRFGLSTNPAVAVAVGATVMTDTLALIVLAVIAGRTTGDAGGAELAAQVVLGLGILVTFCFVLLPPLTRWYFTTIGRQRVLRYTYALGVLLGGATLAESLGIEPIVGAFFTGLAINRLVPNEGEFMEHIEFFGSALLIPIFLVSVGTIIDPRVLLELGTLGIALALIGACVGGKLLASLVSGPAFGYTRNEVGVVFSLTVPQAAATLAATLVGLRIGLFDESTVNAVMVLIAVSLIVASAAATFFGARVPRPSVDASRLARSVLVDVDPTEPDDRAVGIAARLAWVDGGVIRPVVVVGDGAARPVPLSSSGSTRWWGAPASMPTWRSGTTARSRTGSCTPRPRTTARWSFSPRRPTTGSRPSAGRPTTWCARSTCPWRSCIQARPGRRGWCWCSDPTRRVALERRRGWRSRSRRACSDLACRSWWCWGAWSSPGSSTPWARSSASRPTARRGWRRRSARPTRSWSRGAAATTRSRPAPRRFRATGAPPWWRW